MKNTILGNKFWRWVTVILMALILLLGITQCKAQCPGVDTVYGGQCNMYPITPVNAGNSDVECFVFKPETEIIHLTYMLAQGTACGPFQYSNLSFMIEDTACNVIQSGTIFPVQNNTDVQLDTTQYYQMCLTFTASCTLSAICPQYNLSYLPIKLEYFNAKVQRDNTVFIEWLTTEEINLDYYTIERADSNYVFYEIYKQYRPVYEDIEHYYAYTDKLPPTGQVYYRLKEVDIDGCITVFDPVVVRIKRDIKLNPFDFYDIIGRELKQD